MNDVRSFDTPGPQRGAFERLAFALICSLAAASLAACGGGDDAPAAAAPAPPPAAPTPPAPPASTGSPLTLSVSTPATLNGTLDKAVGLFEAGSSNDVMTTFNATDNHCRVGAYALRNSGDGTLYYLEVSFRKDTLAAGFIRFGRDAGLVLLARAPAPLPGVAVDIASRRIVFTNVVVGATGSTTVTVNGSLEYPTNVAPENRAACG
jgi:hypothetical protein